MRAALSRWFGRSNGVEARASGYTDALTGLLLRTAEGDARPTGRASETTAVEACAGLWARAFLSARVEADPPTPTVDAVTPAVLECIGRRLVWPGEAVFMLEVQRGRLAMLEATTWDVRGEADPRRWRYRLQLTGPDSHRTLNAPAEGVVHVRASTDPARPWEGVGPMRRAGLTGDLAAALELRLGEEAAAPVGAILPLPTDEATDSLRADIRAAKGRMVVTETMAGGFGEGVAQAPRRDWEARRFGGSPPDALRSLRSDVASGIACACGVPAVLMGGRADGTALREAWRQFLFGTVAPFARCVEAELSAKLETSVKLTFDELRASDLAGRARAFQSMVGGGMAVEAAAALAGLMQGEAE